jgi:hypothetical protein
MKAFPVYVLVRSSQSRPDNNLSTTQNLRRRFNWRTMNPVGGRRVYSYRVIGM